MKTKNFALHWISRAVLRLQWQRESHGKSWVKLPYIGTMETWKAMEKIFCHWYLSSKNTLPSKKKFKDTHVIQKWILDEINGGLWRIKTQKHVLWLCGQPKTKLGWHSTAKKKSVEWEIEEEEKCPPLLFSIILRTFYIFYSTNYT